MASDVIINIKVDQTLIAFMENLYGPQPITFPRKDNFNLLLHHLVSPALQDRREKQYAESNLAIVLPYFDDKNVFYNYYLNERRQRIFEQSVDNLFRITFRCEIDRALRLCITRIDAVYVFIDKYNLDINCFDMLIKDYQRYRKAMAQKKYRENRKNLVS